MTEVRLVVNINYWRLIIPKIYEVLQQNKDNERIQYFNI